MGLFKRGSQHKEGVHFEGSFRRVFFKGRSLSLGYFKGSFRREF